MTFRSVIFWAHLVAGVTAGLVILVMSATGVLLTYERQLVEWAEQQHAVDAAAGRAALTVDELTGIYRERHPDGRRFDLRFVNRPGAAITLWAGDDHVYLVDPYSGAVLREGEGATVEFFHFVTEVHRWLGVHGDGVGIARAVTAYSNLLFLFLIVTGIYLWLPRAWRWPNLKSKMFFNPKVRNAKARDFNWHHVFSFWALVPLLLIVSTATVFYFPWANAAVYGAFGEEAPERREHEHGNGDIEPVEGALTQQALLNLAIQHAGHHGAPDWYSIWMKPALSSGDMAEFYVDRSIGRRPALAYELDLDGADGSVVRYQRLTDYSHGDQARDFVRFLHTGEVYGFIGQTIAGLASLAASLLVYTGIALAWRRLVSPVFRRRAPPPTGVSAPEQVDHQGKHDADHDHRRDRDEHARIAGTETEVPRQLAEPVDGPGRKLQRRADDEQYSAGDEEPLGHEILGCSRPSV